MGIRLHIYIMFHKKTYIIPEGLGINILFVSIFIPTIYYSIISEKIIPIFLTLAALLCVIYNWYRKNTTSITSFALLFLALCLIFCLPDICTNLYPTDGKRIENEEQYEKTDIKTGLEFNTPQKFLNHWKKH